MLFDINNTNYKFREEFNEFPDIEKHTFEFTKCICGSSESIVVSTVSRHRNFLPIVACTRCGTLRANPYFTRETAAYYYGQVYGDVKRSDKTPAQLFNDQNDRTIVPFFKDLMPEFDSVLDFGGGAGGRTAGFLAEGKVVSLHEVEGNYSQFAYDNGILPYDNAIKYDLVVVSHVIEHMIDPFAEMKTIIQDCCKPDGLLYVATPIIDRQRARQWLQHFHIAHKYYFTHDSFIGLMAGLGCELIKHNNNDGFLFKVGRKVDRNLIEKHFNDSSRKVQEAVEKELRPTKSKIMQLLRFWRPQPHNQAAPRTPELSP
ncbi:methyltransferase domain-containing protein [Roseibium porphyridii]|uniref:Methyltransferase domain-containing protein n=1 Tax=Roseibium porphyridii TaxID=2866279 RepID=A0ABY8F5D7_9HYPH|nr:methyltransferase domain-containing protein [Roseibium sp. KMA01]WFE87933.1 methyltransferase domain-containing protein [Roseibium sp. KMA01]